MRAEKVGRDTLLAQIVQMVAQAQRSRAPIQRLADQVSALVRAARDRGRARRLRRLGDVRAGAALRLRPGRGGQRADHRLPLRARPRDADVDHGRRRPRRAGRRADQERRGARAHGEGRHAGGRQDRHADRGQAEGGRRACRPPASTRTSCCGSPRASSARASIRWPRAIVAAAAERRLDARAGARISIRRAGKGVIGMVEGRRVVLGNAELPGRARRRDRQRSTPRPSACARTARPRSSSRSTASSPASSPSPIRSSRRTPEALAALAREGIRVVMLTGDNRTTARGGGAPARHRRGRGRGAARGQERGRRAAARRGPRGRDGGRRRQRRAGARRRRRRHRHGHRHRRRDRERRRHAARRATSPASCARAGCRRAIMRNIRQNLFFAFVYNAAGVPIAAGVLYPVFGILLSPIIAAAAMARRRSAWSATRCGCGAQGFDARPANERGLTTRD